MAGSTRRSGPAVVAVGRVLDLPAPSRRRTGGRGRRLGPRPAVSCARSSDSSQIRWNVSVGGDQHLPRRKGALIVVNCPTLRARADLHRIGDQRGRRPAGALRRTQRLGPARPAGASHRRAPRPPRRAVRRAPRRRTRGHGCRGDASALRRGRRVSSTIWSVRRPRPVCRRTRRRPTARPFGRSARVEIGQATRPTRQPSRTARRARTRRPPAQPNRDAARTRWATSAPVPARLAAAQRRRRRAMTDRRGEATGMTYVRSTDGTRIHYSVTGRPGAPPILFIQGLGADKHGWDLQRLATAPWYQRRGPRQPRRGPQRQAARPVLARADGRRCDRRARPCRCRHRARRRRIDGRRDQPDHRGQVSRADPVVDAGVHRRPEPPVARGTADELARRRARARHQLDGPGSGPLGDRATIVPSVCCRRSDGSARSRSVGRPTRSPRSATRS